MQLDQFDIESLRLESSNTLCGEHTTEANACAVVDSFLNNCKLFKVFSEVKGFYFQPRLDTEETEARIDRILIPTTEAEEAGWHGGIVGLEIKRSGGTIGPAVTQAMDYTRCCFRLHAGILIVPTWIFVFPMRNPFQGVESLMTNNRIGQCYDNPYRQTLRFTVGSFAALEMRLDGTIPIIKTPPFGNRRGHRSPIKK